MDGVVHCLVRSHSFLLFVNWFACYLAAGAQGLTRAESRRRLPQTQSLAARAPAPAAPLPESAAQLQQQLLQVEAEAAAAPTPAVAPAPVPKKKGKKAKKGAFHQTPLCIFALPNLLASYRLLVVF